MHMLGIILTTFGGGAVAVNIIMMLLTQGILGSITGVVVWGVVCIIGITVMRSNAKKK